MTPDAAVAALAALVEPPHLPTPPAVIDWDEFARSNGFEAPVDYRLLMETYGSGGFGTGSLPGGWLYTLDPFAPGLSLVELSEWDRRNARGLQRRFPGQFPDWPMWPAEVGLLPWANSADGDLIGWWTVGEPSMWGTRFFGRADEFEEFPFGAAEFILRLLTGSLGATGLDRRFVPLETGEELRFFPIAADAARDPGRLREHVTVVFAGLATVIDQAALPSSEELFRQHDPDERMRLMANYQQRRDSVLRPGDDIIQSWRIAAKQAGFAVSGYGTHSAGRGDPLHHEISGSFDPALESVARRLVVELSARLGVGITEVRNLEHAPIWQDLTIRR